MIEARDAMESKILPRPAGREQRRQKIGDYVIDCTGKVIARLMAPGSVLEPRLEPA